MPDWSEEFEFPPSVPELGLLRIEVHEYDMSETYGCFWRPNMSALVQIEKWDFEQFHFIALRERNTNL